MEKIQRGQAADDRGHNRGEEYRDRMHVALVKNSQNHIHNKNRGEQQHRQRAKQLLEHERFALEDALHAWVMRMDLRESVLNELGGIADGDVRQQVEVERDAGELIQMVDSLGTDNFLC